MPLKLGSIESKILKKHFIFHLPRLSVLHWRLDTSNQRVNAQTLALDKYKAKWIQVSINS